MPLYFRHVSSNRFCVLLCLNIKSAPKQYHQLFLLLQGMHKLVLRLVLFSASDLTDCQQKSAQTEQFYAQPWLQLRALMGLSAALHLAMLQRVNRTDSVNQKICF